MPRIAELHRLPLFRGCIALLGVATAVPAWADAPITAVPPADYRVPSALRAGPVRMALPAMSPARRVVLPEPLLRRSNIKRDVTLIGVRDHLELWNREEWQAHLDALEARESEIAMTSRELPSGSQQNIHPTT